MIRRSTAVWSVRLDGDRRQFGPTSSGLGMRISQPYPTAGSTLVLHHDLQSMAEHIERHLAFDRVVTALHFAFPELATNYSFASSRSIIRALRRDPDSAEFMDLRDGYLTLVETTIEHAAKLKWLRRTPRGATVYFSPTGMLVVQAQGIIRTAFLAGFPDDAAEPEDEFPVKRGTGGGGDEDPALAHFNEVFKPAVTMLKRAPTKARPGHPSEYGVLRACEGIGTRPTFPEWIDFCGRVGWHPLEAGGTP